MLKVFTEHVHNIIKQQAGGLIIIMLLSAAENKNRDTEDIG